MIKVINGSLFDSKANFIVHQTNCMGIMGSGVAKQVAERYPHVEKEYQKYLRYCKKHKIEPLGTVQYVPDEVWALIMTDTMKNDNIIAFDTDYTYIVNLFGQAGIGSGLQTDIEAFEKCLKDIYHKAKKLGATVAMPYRIASYRGGAKWDDILTIIKDVFTDVDVELWRYDRG